MDENNYTPDSLPGTEGMETQHTWKPKHRLSGLMTKKMIPLLGAVLLIAGVAAVVALQRGSLDTRQKASTSTGTVTLTWKPGSGYLVPNTKQTIELQTNTGLEQVFGYEITIDFTGTLPSDFLYTPASVPGLSTAPDPTDVPLVFTQTSTGRRLTFGLLTPLSPRTAFTTANGTVTLGSISFTSPASGTMNVSIVPQLSRALRFNATSSDTTETDILKTPSDVVYTFGSAPTATPAPTTAPTPIVSGTPKPSATPTSNDTTPPTVSLTYPANGATFVRGANVVLTADATDNVAVSKVEFLLNGVLIKSCADTTSPYSCKWKVPGKRNANYTISAKAYDAAGNTASSSAVINVP